MESSPGLPLGAPQVHEHRWTDDIGGSKVRLKRKESGVSEGWEELDMSKNRRRVTPCYLQLQGCGLQRDSTLLMSFYEKSLFICHTIRLKFARSTTDKFSVMYPYESASIIKLFRIVQCMCQLAL